ncbi:MAG: YdcF family protein [Oscillospiraceae bacterium]|nr:YdcF family protein [Oscillospiraceae bacterium]
MKIFKRIVLILIVLLTVYVIYIAVDIWRYGNIDETATADAVIVLGAGVLDNKPSPVFEERINHGILLYKNGYVDKIIFTGGKGKNSEYSDSFIARNYAIENGVPFEDIFIEEQSTITQENISYAKQIIEDNNFSMVIIVSDPLHMKRAMIMSKDYGLTAYSSPTPTTKYETLTTKLPFLAREVFFYIGYKIFGRFYQ